jgi:hypothetical protein
MKKTMSESTYDNKLRPGYYENNYANMAAAFVVETERWKLAPTLFLKYSFSYLDIFRDHTLADMARLQQNQSSMTVRSSTAVRRLSGPGSRIRHRPRSFIFRSGVSCHWRTTERQYHVLHRRA